MTGRPSLGLRARLLFAFALLCVVTAAAVAGGIYVQARNDILQRAQDAAVLAMKSRLEALFPLRSATPGPAELDEIARTVTDGNSHAVAIYGGSHSSPGSPQRPWRPGGNWPILDLDPGTIPKGLRWRVAHGEFAWQRVAWPDGPNLVIGTPLLIIEQDGTTRMSGIEVYTARSLGPEQ
ncbi:two-component sensor histidine kinase, partial [Nonomuraea insulae]